ncbi:MAG: ribonuclease [Clostridiales bacterium]|jgi:ribonuclease HIII|nr:ribonuclease [Clostridiales bacterium]MDK2932497.1 ribonuclease [Clostridiales bacterium]
MLYCSIEYLNKLIGKKLPEAAQQGFHLETYKEIPYGIQLFFIYNGKKYIINLYYTEKKGLKVVSNIKKPDDNNDLLVNIFTDGVKLSVKQRNNAEQLDLSTLNFGVWIGTDESGKGDYFGPLVAAGFIIDKKIVYDIENLGIKDSKKISDKKIMEMSEYLHKNFQDSISICELSPGKYNQLYQRLIEQKKNLNHLLAWTHARVIENLLMRNDKVEGAIADQFGNERYINNALMERGRAITLLQRTKAEEDPAVAAASILARHRFIIRMKQLQEKYKMDLPKGAGQAVSQAAIKFIKTYGKDQLSNVAKLHFKITNKIMMMDS